MVTLNRKSTMNLRYLIFRGIGDGLKDKQLLYPRKAVNRELQGSLYIYTRFSHSAPTAVVAGNPENT